jgi:GTP cyclohydrolase I
MAKYPSIEPQSPDSFFHQRTEAEIEEAQDHVRGILKFLSEDPNREGLQDTPARVVRAYAEHFSGYALDPSEYLAKTFEEVEGYDELVLVIVSIIWCRSWAKRTWLTCRVDASWV